MTREEALKVAKPILFNTDMTQAIQDNRKTATRRVIKLKYGNTHIEWHKDKYGRCLVEMQNDVEGETYGVRPDGTHWQKILAMREIKLPYKVGDILYVRETWCRSEDWEDDALSTEFLEDMLPIYYRADWEEGTRDLARWKPSIHMPKEAARIFLRVTNVRVERLQDMTEEDAFMEGFSGIPWCAHLVFENYPDSPIPCEAAVHSECPLDPPCNHSIPELFGSDIWDKTIKKSDLAKYGWAANPWVWVIEFERLEVTK